MVHDYMLDKVLRRFKEIIGIKEFDNAKILIDKHDKLPDNIACFDINGICYKR